MELENLVKITAKQFRNTFFPNSFHLQDATERLVRNLIIRCVHAVSNVHGPLTDDEIRSVAHMLWGIMKDEFCPKLVNRHRIEVDEFMIMETELFLRTYRVMFSQYLQSQMSRSFGIDIGPLMMLFLEPDEFDVTPQQTSEKQEMDVEAST